MKRSLRTGVVTAVVTGGVVMGLVGIPSSAAALPTSAAVHSGIRVNVSAIFAAAQEIADANSKLSRAGTTTKKKALAQDLIGILSSTCSRYRCTPLANQAIASLQEAMKNSGWASASKKTLAVVKWLNDLAQDYIDAENRNRGKW